MPREPTQQELWPEEQNHAQSTIVPQTNLLECQHGEPRWKMSRKAHHLLKTKIAITPLGHFLQAHNQHTWRYHSIGSSAKEIIYIQQKNCNGRVNLTFIHQHKRENYHKMLRATFSEHQQNKIPKVNCLCYHASIDWLTSKYQYPSSIFGRRSNKHFQVLSCGEPLNLHNLTRSISNLIAKKSSSSKLWSGSLSIDGSIPAYCSTHCTKSF